MVKSVYPLGGLTFSSRIGETMSSAYQLLAIQTVGDRSRVGEFVLEEEVVVFVVPDEVVAVFNVLSSLSLVMMQ